MPPGSGRSCRCQIRQDETGTEYERTMGEYLCNPLNQDLLDVSISTGGFYTSRMVNLELSKEPKVRKGRRLLFQPAKSFGSRYRPAMNMMSSFATGRFAIARRAT